MLGGLLFTPIVLIAHYKKFKLIKYELKVKCLSQKVVVKQQRSDRANLQIYYYPVHDQLTYSKYLKY